MDVTLRPARRDEATRVFAPALRSKGHRGYDKEFLGACRAALTRAPAQLDSGGARRVAEVPSGSIPGRLLPRLQIAL